MQRPTAEDVRADCRRIADVAEPTDTIRSITHRLDGELSRRQVERRLAAMERELGLEPSPPSDRGQGCRRADGTREHSRPHRRAGEVVRTWRRHCL